MDVLLHSMTAVENVMLVDVPTEWTLDDLRPEMHGFQVIPDHHSSWTILLYSCDVGAVRILSRTV